MPLSASEQESLKGRVTTLKGRDGQFMARRREGDHAMKKGRCLKRCPYRYAKNRRLGHTPGRGMRQRISGTRTHASTPYREVQLPRMVASEPPCAEYHRMKRPGEKKHRAAPEADRPTTGGREATGPEEGPRPTPSLARGIHTEASPEVKTT